MKRWRMWVLPLVVGGLSVPLEDMAAQVKITVGSNVQVSKLNANVKHDELLGCVDANNPNHLVVGSIADYLDNFDPWTIAYVSFDHGKTWEIGVNNRPADSWSEDPACAYGPDGTAYFAAILSGERGDNSVFFRSPDGGKSWLPSSVIFGAFDRPFLSVDSTGGRYNGRIYVAHNALGGIGLQRSVDGGRTFLGPVLRPNLEQLKVPLAGLILNSANAVVLSDGTVLAGFYEQLPARDGRGGTRILSIVRSTDGGEHLKDEAKIAEYSYGSSLELPQTIPGIAVDQSNSVFKDRVYAVWQSTLDEGPGRSIRQESFVSHSSDGGSTWSKPISIRNDERTEINTSEVVEYQTTATVNKDGVVGVMWYEGFSTSTAQGYSVRFAASLDGGETWTPSVRVSEAPCTFGGNERLQMTGRIDHPAGSPLELGLWNRIRFDSGDTAGLVADSTGSFHAFWIDNRTGISQVWTAPIVVAGAVLKNGAAELAGLDDITDSVEATVVHSTFDIHTGNLSTVLRLTNVSKQTIRPPLKLRILDLRSDVGSLQSISAQNGVHADGAILDLSDLLPGGILKNDGTPIEKSLIFEISNPVLRADFRWYFREGEGRILNLRARLYGRLSRE